MRGRSGSSNLLWGPYAVTLSSAALAVLSLLSNETRPWYLAIGIFCFIVMHSAINHLRDRSTVRRLGRQHDSVQRRVLRIVADLGELVGGQFDLLMVDLYLLSANWQMRRSWPFVVYEQALSREMSVSLLEVTTQPSKVTINSGLHGKCFTSKNALVWFNGTDFSTSDGEPNRSVVNEWELLTEVENAEIGHSYGLVTMSPVVDHLDKKCIGVLVVHVKPERGKVFRVHGALLSSKARRRIHDACVDLHALILA